MRKAQAKKLPLAPDPRYNDKLVTRFVNNIMWQGKKSTAYDIFYDAVQDINSTRTWILKVIPLLGWLFVLLYLSFHYSARDLNPVLG